VIVNRGPAGQTLCAANAGGLSVQIEELSIRLMRSSTRRSGHDGGHSRGNLAEIVIEFVVELFVR